MVVPETGTEKDQQPISPSLRARGAPTGRSCSPACASPAAMPLGNHQMKPNGSKGIRKECFGARGSNPNYLSPGSFFLFGAFCLDVSTSSSFCQLMGVPLNLQVKLLVGEQKAAEFVFLTQNGSSPPFFCPSMGCSSPRSVDRRRGRRAEAAPGLRRAPAAQREAGCGRQFERPVFRCSVDRGKHGGWALHCLVGEAVVVKTVWDTIFGW